MQNIPDLEVEGLEHKMRSASGSTQSSASSLEPLTEVFDIPLPRSPVAAVSQPSPLGTPRVGPLKGKRSPRLDSPPLSLEELEPGVSPPASPPSSSTPLIAPASPLIADENFAKSRCIISKSHCLYPPPSSLVPFTSCVLGFRVIIHPADSRVRVKWTQISLTLHSAPTYPASLRPVVKALHPTQGVIVRSSEGMMVRYHQESSLAVSLGFDPYGKIQLGHTRGSESQRLASPFMLGSGLETNRVLFTLNEDSSHLGVPPSLDFAVLLYLPNPDTRAFEADISVESTISGSTGELSTAIRRVFGSPKTWRLSYDGEVELGRLDIGGVVVVDRSTAPDL